MLPHTQLVTTNALSLTTDGDDFVAIDDVITFEMEDLQATIFTLVLDNLSLEGVEEFTAHIEPVVGDFPVAVQNSSATVSIRDNDGLLLYKHVCTIYQTRGNYHSQLLYLDLSNQLTLSVKRMIN